MTDIDCAMCGAPTEYDGEAYPMMGYGPAGNIRVWFVRMLCAAGHRYQEEIREEILDE